MKKIQFGKNYYITENGKVLKIIKTKTIELKLLKKNGYYYINLWNNNKRKSFYVHRLVADNFLTGKTLFKRFVDHKDGNKLNNHYSNLEWVTPKENIRRYHELNRESKVYINGQLFGKCKNIEFKQEVDYEII